MFHKTHQKAVDATTDFESSCTCPQIGCKSSHKTYNATGNILIGITGKHYTTKVISDLGYYFSHK